MKFNGLSDAIKAAEKQVGPNTIILSLLNGISSEELIGQAFGRELYSVAQKVNTVAGFFETVGLSYQVDADMPKRLWGKFMLNVGVHGLSVPTNQMLYDTIKQMEHRF